MSASEAKTVLCYGDSNTHGTVAMTGPDEGERLPFATRWPNVLAAELGSGWRVIDEGQPGRTTVHDDPVEGVHKNGLRALPVLLETHCPVDVAVIMLGTNDLKTRFSVGPDDVARSIQRLANVVDTSCAGPSGRAPDAILVAPVPIEESGWLAEMFAGGAVKSRGLGAAIAEVARRLGAGFIDAGEFAEVDPLDGIHLTTEGHEAIGKAVAATVLARAGGYSHGRKPC